jgi:hypothetical protein
MGGAAVRDDTEKETVGAQSCEGGVQVRESDGVLVIMRAEIVKENVARLVRKGAQGGQLSIDDILLDVPSGIQLVEPRPILRFGNAAQEQRKPLVLGSNTRGGPMEQRAIQIAFARNRKIPNVDELDVWSVW